MSSRDHDRRLALLRAAQGLAWRCAIWQEKPEMLRPGSGQGGRDVRPCAQWAWPAKFPVSEVWPGPRVYFKLFEHAGEAVAGLVADGKTTPAGAPKNPLQLGATFWHFRHESRVTSTPIWVQNLILPPLWALARVFGVRPYYHHWDSRT